MKASRVFLLIFFVFNNFVSISQNAIDIDKMQIAYVEIPNPIVFNESTNEAVFAKKGKVYKDETGRYWWVPKMHDYLILATVKGNDTIVKDTSFFELRGITIDKIDAFVRSGGREYPKMSSFRGLYLLFDKEYQHLNLSKEIQIVSYDIVVKDVNGTEIGGFHFDTNENKMENYQSLQYLISSNKNTTTAEIFNIKVSCTCWDNIGVLEDDLSIKIL